jgi:hypothetical protein
MRVGIEGDLLVANDAARDLLSGGESGQALDTVFTTGSLPEHPDVAAARSAR